MKTILKSITALFFGATFLITSCSKYEDGPAISLISRTERVANTWKVEEAYADNEDVTDDYRVYEVYLSKDGDAELTAEYELLGQDFSIETDGTWQFTNNADNIKVDFENDDADNEYQILKLTETEFWIREVGGEVELHLIEK